MTISILPTLLSSTHAFHLCPWFFSTRSLILYTGFHITLPYFCETMSQPSRIEWCYWIPFCCKVVTIHVVFAHLLCCIVYYFIIVIACTMNVFPPMTYPLSSAIRRCFFAIFRIDLSSSDTPSLVFSLTRNCALPLLIHSSSTFSLPSMHRYVQSCICSFSFADLNLFSHFIIHSLYSCIPISAHYIYCLRHSIQWPSSYSHHTVFHALMQVIDECQTVHLFYSRTLTLTKLLHWRLGLFFENPHTKCPSHSSSLCSLPLSTLSP